MPISIMHSSDHLTCLDVEQDMTRISLCKQVKEESLSKILKRLLLSLEETREGIIRTLVPADSDLLAVRIISSI